MDQMLCPATQPGRPEPAMFMVNEIAAGPLLFDYVFHQPPTAARGTLSLIASGFRVGSPPRPSPEFGTTRPLPSTPPPGRAAVPPGNELDPNGPVPVGSCDEISSRISSSVFSALINPTLRSADHKSASGILPACTSCNRATSVGASSISMTNSVSMSNLTSPVTLAKLAYHSRARVKPRLTLLQHSVSTECEAASSDCCCVAVLTWPVVSSSLAPSAAICDSLSCIAWRTRLLACACKMPAVAPFGNVRI